ncbi:hypothetical protein [Synoicihabitans lomoniglobus]|uniref:Uncharacterized protein n=1 Tax=Synoicihabitans lomoniglobus TaxID=2909285 RepID=A0AAE9ZU66_9BACT|nr:hypothetical protein [Opitutaceae bacterium LMO-M01]WED64167.1 hypothetical protein PXH66_17655 [Opitutaceae bacterium LMO-M01]
MSSSSPAVIRWLVRHAGYPAHRLAPGAERLVLFAAAAAAAADEAGVQRASGMIVRKNSAEEASRRQQAENRRKAHFKSDNRTAT